MNKRYWLFYGITLILLIIISIYPLFHFFNLLLFIQFDMLGYMYYFSLDRINGASIVPFAPTILAIIVGFVISPVLIRIKGNRDRLIWLLLSVGFFLFVEIYMEDVISKYKLSHQILMSRMLGPIPEMLRMSPVIPFSIKVHYYIFSLILILTTVLLLHNLSMCIKRNYVLTSTDKKSLLLQFIVWLLNSVAYILGALVVYEDRAVSLISSSSAIKVSTCIIFASTALGLFTGNALYYKHRGKLSGPVIAVLAAVLLYAAECLMLKGRIYLLGQGLVFQKIPFIGISIVDMVVIVLPALFTYIGLKTIHRESAETIVHTKY